LEIYREKFILKSEDYFLKFRIKELWTIGCYLSYETDK